jgi:NitT/TauT family transport system substrate-binding protein
MRKSIGIALAFMFLSMNSPVQSQEKVRFVLDWVIAGRHTAYYVAIDKGYWKKAGLDVTMSRGFGGANTVKSVTAGTAHVGKASAGPALVARAKGAPIKIVSIIYGKAPFMMVSKAKTGVKVPKDLEGKTIGAPAGDANRFVFPALAGIAGIDEKKVKWVTMSPSAKTPSLLSDKVNVIVHFAFEKVKFERLQAKHGAFNIMMYADHGLDMYSIGLQVLDSYIRTKPKVLRAFVHGAMKGYAWTLKHPKEANRIFSKHQPTLNQEIALGELDVVRELVMTEEAKRHCIGWISEKKLAQTRDILFKALRVKETLDIKEAYTTKFLPCG